MFVMRFIFLSLIYFGTSESALWPKGVVHFAINPKDYDLHSQDEIVSAFSVITKEICVKFFSTPLNFNASVDQKVLYINNPDKQKNCVPHRYNFSGSVVEMPIGYNCINKRDIAKQVIDMLKASIVESNKPINSFDLVRRFDDKDQAKSRPTFLTTEDRDYINAHYLKECSLLSSRVNEFASRRSGDVEIGGLGAAFSPENAAYYKQRVWPYGLVVYTVNDTLVNTDSYRALMRAMQTIEFSSCIVFHKSARGNPSTLRFGDTGEDEPRLGFTQEDQWINLNKMTRGAPGHTSHTLNNLLRALGIPMMSNRYDRDNFISVLWAHVQRGKERLLEKSPKEAWVLGIPYDFASATHGPTNYLCGDCQPGDNTLQPLQDYMWRNSMIMGHKNELSDADKTLLHLAYGYECKARLVAARD